MCALKVGYTSLAYKIVRTFGNSRLPHKRQIDIPSHGLEEGIQKVIEAARKTKNVEFLSEIARFASKNEGKA